MSDTDSTGRSDGLSYRSPTTPLHAWHDEPSSPVSTTVVTAVARAAAVEPTELPPLFDSIDPDALDKLLRSDEGRDPGFDGYLTFTYAGHSVTVHADGEIVVIDIDSA